ncbi:MAG: BrnT family toxin [Deltaproteobacteria bacterium]|nr:BrnT family toxin [Deltaproteobacteria bacterium]
MGVAHDDVRVAERVDKRVARDPVKNYIVVVPSDLRFEWDLAKSRANRRKHGVAFEEAQSVFADERGLLVHDRDHSEGEDRFVLLGFSSALRMLVVCHCYRGEDDVIRIISARKADRRERAQYVQRWEP